MWRKVASLTRTVILSGSPRSGQDKTEEVRSTIPSRRGNGSRATNRLALLEETQKFGRPPDSQDSGRSRFTKEAIRCSIQRRITCLSGRARYNALAEPAKH